MNIVGIINLGNSNLMSLTNSLDYLNVDYIIVNNENEDLGEGGYDYQNHNDSSEVNEKKITQSFQIFGLTPNSTMEQIKGKYRYLCLKYHPDKNKNTDTTTKMSEINSAYEIIMKAIS